MKRNLLTHFEEDPCSLDEVHPNKEDQWLVTRRLAHTCSPSKEDHWLRGNLLIRWRIPLLNWWRFDCSMKKRHANSVTYWKWQWTDWRVKISRLKQEKLVLQVDPHAFVHTYKNSTLNCPLYSAVTNRNARLQGQIQHHSTPFSHSECHRNTWCLPRYLTTTKHIKYQRSPPMHDTKFCANETLRMFIYYPLMYNR